MEAPAVAQGLAVALFMCPRHARNESGLFRVDDAGSYIFVCDGGKM